MTRAAVHRKTVVHGHGTSLDSPAVLQRKVKNGGGGTGGRAVVIEDEVDVGVELNTSRCLPSLRYLSLAEPTAKPPLEFVDEYDCSPFRWWRVVRDDNGAPVEVKEKPTWEGDRVSAFLRAADPLATAGRFDGMGRCVPVCMYKLTLSPQRNVFRSTS